MGSHKPYQGHKNHAAWNVSLYLFNEYALYTEMRRIVSTSRTLNEAAKRIMSELGLEGAKTPDGVPYTYTNVRLALSNWEA